MWFALSHKKLNAFFEWGEHFGIYISNFHFVPTQLLPTLHVILYLVFHYCYAGTFSQSDYVGCVSESGDFKNVINSKRFQLCSFNTHEHNVYIKPF
jgi:hypothetical protein